MIGITRNELDKTLKDELDNYKNKMSLLEEGDNLKELTSKVNNIETELKDSTLTSFKTDVQTTKLEGCNGGFVSVDKIEGKTLINKSPRISNSNWDIQGGATKSVDSFNIPKSCSGGVVLSNVSWNTNSIYTVIIEVSNYIGKSSITIADDAGYYISNYNKIDNKQGRIIFTFKTKSIFNKGEDKFKITTITDANSSYTINSIMIIEGDWTNNPPSDYFEGMKSVGEVSYVNGKYSGKNLINDKNKYRLYVNGGTSTNSIVLSQDSSSLVLENPPVNVDLTFTNHIGDRVLVATFDSLAANSRPIEILAKDSKISTFKITKQARYLVAYLDSTGKDVKAQLEFGTLSTEYEEYYEGCKIEFGGKGENLLDTSLFKPDTYVTNFKNDGNTITYSCTSNHNGTQVVSLSYLTGKEVTISALAKRARFVVSSCYYKGIFYDIMDTTTPSDDNEVLISRTFTLTSQSTININCSVFPGNSSIRNIMMTVGNEVKEYIPFRENKTEILLPEPLADGRKILSDGTFEIGSKEFVLNDASDVKCYSPNLAKNINTTGFYIFLSDVKSGSWIKSELLSTTINVWDNDIEGIFNHYDNGNIYFNISNSKTGIITTDTAIQREQKLKNYLKTNNIKILYPLKDSDKKYISLNKILKLRGYDNLIVNSGAIQPTVSYSYAKTTGERITSVEDTVDGVKNKVNSIENTIDTLNEEETIILTPLNGFTNWANNNYATRKGNSVTINFYLNPANVTFPFTLNTMPIFNLPPSLIPKFNKDMILIPSDKGLISIYISNSGAVVFTTPTNLAPSTKPLWIIGNATYYIF